MSEIKKITYSIKIEVEGKKKPYYLYRIMNGKFIVSNFKKSKKYWDEYHAKMLLRQIQYRFPFFKTTLITNN